MTRRLVVTENLTLDGVVENDGTWFDPTEDSERGRELASPLRLPAKDLLLICTGRRQPFPPSRPGSEAGPTA